MQDFVAPFGRSFDPETGVVRIGVLDDVGQNGIEQLVAKRRRIGDDELLRIGIDAVFQCQIRQRRARQDDISRVPRQRAADVPFVGIQDEQKCLFRDRQHRLLSPVVERAAARYQSIRGSASAHDASQAYIAYRTTLSLLPEYSLLVWRPGNPVTANGPPDCCCPRRSAAHAAGRSGSSRAAQSYRDAMVWHRQERARGAGVGT